MLLFRSDPPSSGAAVNRARKRPRTNLHSARPSVEPLEIRLAPAILTVTTFADNGDNMNPTPGSLRATIRDSAAGDTIKFNIQPPGTYTIAVPTVLPTIDHTLAIDGYSEPTAMENGLPFAQGNNAAIRILLTPTPALEGDPGLDITAGNCVIKGFEIYGFVDAIDIHGQNAQHNHIRGNVIGSVFENLTNQKDGVHLSYASHNVIGGTTPAEANIISGNSGFGVSISDLSRDTVGNEVVRNYIGSQADGVTSSPNHLGGVLIKGVAATNNVVGGPVAGARNLISGNSGPGVTISEQANRNEIEGNYIGLQANGTGVLPNSGDGVDIIGASSNTVGGFLDQNIAPGGPPGNVISGNPSSGVVITATGAQPSTLNLVAGNVIGLAANGNDARPNSSGVYLGTATNNDIGHSEPAARNIISGNTNNGIWISTGGDANRVEGNYIGTDALGNTARANGRTGILVDGGNNNGIGGSATPTGSPPGNVISGNGTQPTDAGIRFVSGTGNQVFGNLIGTNSAGKAAVPNENGIVIAGLLVTNTVIGGAGGNANSIGGNINFGLDLSGNTNQDQGNVYGKDHLANGAGGIRISGNNNVISGDVIAFNNGPGIEILTGAGNSLTRNSIQRNSVLGIDLGGSGVPLMNTPGGPHNGPNHLQNYPVLDCLTLANGMISISGTLNSTPNHSFTIEFFSNSQADPTGYGQGESYLDSESVTTDGSGNAAIPVFQVSTTSPAFLGPYITATASDSVTGDTSEFSVAMSPLSVAGVHPASGPAGGGTTVIITGSGFKKGDGSPNVTQVLFGTTTATPFTINSATQITATSPAHLPGAVDVTVTNAACSSPTSPSDQFNYYTGVISTTASLVSSLNPSIHSQSVTFTATVSGSGGTPTGNVSYFDGGIFLGSGQLNNGAATFTTSSLAVGNHNIIADYSGDTVYAGSVSATLVQTVNPASTSTGVSSSLNPSIYSQLVTFTATVTSTTTLGGTPTGTVSFFANGAVLGAASLNGGMATFTTGAVPVGSNTITATYGGDAVFQGSSGSLFQTVNPATSSMAVTSSLNPSVFTQPVTFTATVTSGTALMAVPTGNVYFFANGAFLGQVQLSNGMAAISTSDLPIGSNTIMVTYPGDAIFQGTTGGLFQTVNAATSNTLLTSSLNPSLVGQPVTFTATVTSANLPGGMPTGSVSFYDNLVLLDTVQLNVGSASYTTSTLTVGSHQISATYSGDAVFQGSGDSLTQTVNSGRTPSAPRSVAVLTADCVVDPEAGRLGFSEGNTANATTGDEARSVSFVPALLAAEDTIWARIIASDWTGNPSNPLSQSELGNTMLDGATLGGWAAQDPTGAALANELLWDLFPTSLPWAGEGYTCSAGKGAGFAPDLTIGRWPRR